MPDSKALFDTARQIAASEAISKIPPAGGKRFAELFRHGSLQVQVYAPRARDTQRPHSQDEVYVIMRGSGLFVNGTQRFVFGPGDVLFAAAGEEHRFERYTEDFMTWVFFYGPDGGERAHSSDHDAEPAPRPAPSAAPKGPPRMTLVTGGPASPATRSEPMSASGRTPNGQYRRQYPGYSSSTS
jgi:mannose-6-phosphate isomerase-like protein (cupin superfamily)